MAVLGDFEEGRSPAWAGFAGNGARPGTAPTRRRVVTLPAGLTGAPLYPGLPTTLPTGREVSGRPVAFCARRGGGRLRFPPPWFSPGAPIPRRPLPSADHRPGGKPIPVHSLRSFTGGNRTAAIFVYGAAALRVPPPKSPRRSLNIPIPPQSCGGRSRAAQARRGSHCSGAFPVAAAMRRPFRGNQEIVRREGIGIDRSAGERVKSG